jgi:hypothetical protein
LEGIYRARYIVRQTSPNRFHVTEKRIEGIKMRDLGGMGEAVFTYWCAQAGIACNKAGVDKTGWDFLVELPFSTASGEHFGAVECKVQVKATDGNLKKISIKLSNLYRFATNPLPCFILFIEFDKKSEPQRSYLVHIDDTLVSKILKRKYEFEHQKNITALHDRYMTIVYDDNHRLAINSGSGLTARILMHVPYGNAKYAAKKSQHIVSTGFEDVVGKFTFTANGKNAIHDFIDASIGLSRKIAVSNFELRESRFGITSSRANEVGGTGFIELLDVQPHSSGYVGFSESKASPKLAFACDFFVPPVEWVTREELFKIRIDAKHFELILTPSKGSITVTFKIDVNTQTRITDLKKYVSLINILSAVNQKNCFLSIDLPFNQPIYALLKNGEVSAFHSDFTKAVDSAKEICDRFETIEIATASLANIDRFEDSILAFNSLLTQEPRVCRYEFEAPEPFDENKSIIIITTVSTIIGDHQYGIILTWSGNARRIGQRKYELVTTNSTVVQKLTSDYSGRIDTAHIKEEISRIAEGFDDDCIVFSDYAVHGPTPPESTK